MNKRKIIQLYPITTKHGDRIYALCDDGSTWGFNTPMIKWQPIFTPIPQDELNFDNT